MTSAETRATTAPHASRVVEVIAPGHNELSYGSGCLVGPRTVLTAGSLLPRAHGHAMIRFLGDARPRPARVVCTTAGADGLDAAVLRLDGDLPEELAHAEPLRPGRVITGSGTVAAEAHGFPEAQRRNHFREIEPAVGTIACGSGAVLGRLEFEVSAAPRSLPTSPTAETGDRGPWRGMAGAAVFASGLLVGVVVGAARGWSEARLVVEPITEILAREDFRRALTAEGRHRLSIEAVELIRLAPFPPPPVPVSPVHLLRAQNEVVAFHGRERELDRLRRWCAGTGVGVMLIHGPGGQGKTRLALELLRDRQSRGWACGVTVTDLDEMRDALGRDEVRRGLAAGRVPVLLVIDYAEAWRGGDARTADPVVRILQLCAERDRTHTAPVRLLLVARFPDALWKQLDTLARTLHLTAEPLALEPLSPSAREVPDMYRNAVRAFASRMLHLSGYHTVDWTALASGLRPPDFLRQPRYRHALTLHEQALSDLLQASPDSVDSAAGASVERILLDHETRYWERTAAAHSVPLPPEGLREAVAGLTLFGAATRDQAAGLVRALPASSGAADADVRRIVDWLAQLYPDPHTVWAPLEPDRLGEYLVSAVWGDDDGLLAVLADRIDASAPGSGRTIMLGESQIHRMLVVLDRIRRPGKHLESIAGAVRAVLEFDRRATDYPIAEHREYLRLALHKFRVDAAHIDRLIGEGPATAPWRARWAWWNTQRPAHVVPGTAEHYLALLTLDGTPILVAAGEFTIAIHDPATGRERALLFASDDRDNRISATHAVIHEGALYVALGTWTGEIGVLRYRGGESGEWAGRPTALPGPPDGPRRVVAIHLVREPHGLELVTATYEPRLRVWHPPTGTQIRTIETGGKTTAMVTASLAGRPVLVTADDDHRVRVVALSDGTVLTTLVLEVGSPTAIDVLHPFRDARGVANQDILWAVVGHLDGSVGLHDLSTGAFLGELARHTKSVTAVAVGRLDGQALAVTTGADHRTLVTDIRSGTRFGEPYLGHTGRITALALGEVGTRLRTFTAAMDFTLRQWDVSAAAAPEAALVGHTDRIVDIAAGTGEFASLIVTSSGDHSVRIWDLERGGRGGWPPLLDDSYPTRTTVTALAVTSHLGRPLIVTGDVDGGVDTVPRPADRSAWMWLEHRIVALDVTVLGPDPITVAADNEGAVRAWDPLTGSPVGPATATGMNNIRGLVITTWHGRPVAVVADRTRCTAVDLIVGGLVPEVVGGTVDHDSVVGVAVFGDRPGLIVATTSDRPGAVAAVRVIDARTRRETHAAQHFPARIRAARRIAADGSRPALLVVGDNGEVWVRELDTHLPPAGPIGVVGLGFVNRIPVAVTASGGRLAVVIGGADGALECVDGLTGHALIDTDPANPSAGTVATYRGRRVVVVASSAAKVVCRDSLTGARVDVPVPSRSRLTAMRTVTAADHEIVLAAGYLGVQAWYARTMSPLPAWETVNDKAAELDVLPLGDRLVVVRGDKRALRSVDLESGEPFGADIENPVPAGTTDRIVVAAVLLRGRPTAFVAGVLSPTIVAWDLPTGRKVWESTGELPITRLFAATAGGNEVLYVAHTGGLLLEWPLGELLPRPWFGRLRGRRDPRRVDRPGEITALTTHPGHGLVLARGDILELRPFDPHDPRPIRLGAPINDLACGDHGSIVVITEQGAVVVDVR
ncbi:hypothetical protein ACWDSJ_02070 [Nocardia sp. NPDC003482]